MVAVRRLIGIAAWTFLGTQFVQAIDVYVVRFNTIGSRAFAEPPCTFLSYRDDLVVRNSGAADARITLLGVSNGTAASPQVLTVPPGQTLSSEGDMAAFASWAPTPQPLLWVAHLDVPAEVLLLSRLIVPAHAAAGCDGGPGGLIRTYAGIPMPVVRELTPAGIPRVHLGTDIGGDSGGTADDGRTNVGVYNGGPIPAVATVELRRGCDGGLVASRSATIPPNTIVQLTALSAAFQGCTTLNTATYETYVVVTVDQPSLSYVITLSNTRPPWIPVSSSP